LQKITWRWERQGEFSKLLGYHFEDAGIKVNQAFQKLKATLQEQLDIAKLAPSNLPERITVVNQLFLGSMWYVLTLWPGAEKELKELEKMVVDYLWGGQKGTASHKVDLVTLTKSCKAGGVGLIMITDQVKCMLPTFLLWAICEGSHPLKLLIKIQDKGDVTSEMGNC
jgi:hypothetical protein